VVTAQIDTAADYTLLASGVGIKLGVTVPATRQIKFSGAAGVQTGTASFPPDGSTAILVTDYQEFCYLSNPLVGFHHPTANQAAQRSVMGLTGFLQHFWFGLDLTSGNPFFELEARTNFPGVVGKLPLDRSILDFANSLRPVP
jgi:hypothetical protein